MSEESLLAALAQLRGAAVAYRILTNTVIAQDTSLASSLPHRYQRDPTRALAELQAAENRLAQELRVADHILRPIPSAGTTPKTNVLPDGDWTAVATIEIRETYELELSLPAYQAADAGEAVDHIKWDAMGMSPDEVRAKYKEPNPMHAKLPTYVNVVSVGAPEFNPEKEDAS